MGFNTALSGIKASADFLSATGNNIANSDTTGFKRSRVEFGDLYNTSVVGAGSNNAIGSGVSVNNVAQQFAPGNISDTGSNLDLAVDGNGFFVLDEGGTQIYTRAGDFKLDEEGFLVTNDGANVQGYNAVDGIVGGNLEDLIVPTERIAPQATAEVAIEVQLDFRSDDVPAFIVDVFDPTDPETFNYTQTQTVADGQVPPQNHIVTYYYAKSELPNTYQVYATVDGSPTDDSGAEWLTDQFITFNGEDGYRDALGVVQPGGSQVLYSGTNLPQVSDVAALNQANFSLAGNLNGIAIADSLVVANVIEPSNVSRNAFDPADPSSYNYGNTKNIYDALGDVHTLGYYFIQQGEANTYELKVTVDGRQTFNDPVTGLPTRFVPEDTVVTFDVSGNLSGTFEGFPPFAISSPVQLSITGFDPTDPTAEIPVDLTGSTQYALDSNDEFEQDGFAAGELQGVSFDEDGSLLATYTNQQTAILGQVALATFDNTDGLSPVGNTAWAASSSSGAANVGRANTGTLGSIRGGALEESNVDLTSELVALIEAQRNYQANSKTLETENTVTQTIINL
ncbi:flagellar hook protein FlgE [Marinomonas sp. 2405UD68-3]|uniref:flagellar hook protein FlgE n=1 Tax=Marinomonas sp. 2405UD68-3 TaxID=3391835 RepID=UPI0039C9883E